MSGLPDLGLKCRSRACTRSTVVRVGLGATGGYEQAVAVALRAAEFAVLALQPVQARAFAKFRLQRAKNDRIDARLIAECANAATMRDTVPDERLA